VQEILSSGTCKHSDRKEKIQVVFYETLDEVGLCIIRNYDPNGSPVKSS
jgi:hypothetical protein